MGCSLSPGTSHFITVQEKFLLYAFVQKGIRRDLVSEPRKPDVYLPVVPVAFGSQLNDEVDENERFVVFIRHHYF